MYGPLLRCYLPAACILAFCFTPKCTRAESAGSHSMTQQNSLTSAALNLLSSFDEQQRQKATRSFNDPARLRWNYMPVNGREGLPLGEMTAAQRERAME